MLATGARHGGTQPGGYAVMEIDRMVAAVRRVGEMVATETV